MTRDEFAVLINKAGPDASIDDMYYIVGMAIKQEREACLNDIRIERECWTRGRNDMGVMVCGYIMDSIIKRGMA